MLRIILVRHGQTEWNDGGASGEHFRGRIDIALNPTGVAQAHAVAERLASLSVAAVYSSPLRRAMDTAAPIARRHGLEVIPFPGLLDIDYGLWSGRSHKEVAGRWPDLYRRWLTMPEQVRIPGGECLDDVRRRVVEGLDGLLEKHDGQIVVLLGHQVVNKVLLCHLLGLGADGFWRVRQDTGCINRCDYDGHSSTVLTLNEVCHLPTWPVYLDSLPASR